MTNPLSKHHGNVSNCGELNNEAITETNVNISLVRLCGIQMRVILQRKLLYRIMSLKITFFKLLQYRLAVGD